MSTQTTPYIRQRRRLSAPGGSVITSRPLAGNATPIRPARLQIIDRPISSVRPSPFHARRHPKAQIAKIAASIREFGFNVPILVDANDELIAGHARLEAAKSLGHDTIPVIIVSDLPADRVRAYRIADNKTADGGEWILDVLKTEFDFLSSVDMGLPELSGFGTAEIEGLFCDTSQLDLVGHVLSKEDWRVLSIPAFATDDMDYRVGRSPSAVHRRRAGEVLHPSREPAEWLETAKRTLGSLNFSAQYQQLPLPAGGNAIRRDWIRSYEQPPEEFTLKIASWDTASTLGESSDRSVGTVWGVIGQDYYLLDVVRECFESPELRRAIIDVAKRHSVDATIIEDTELGRALSQDLRRTGDLRSILDRARFDKMARLLGQAPRFEAGQVHLPEHAPWREVYLAELLAFPAGRNDDQVDSTRQALRHLTRRMSVERPRPQGTRYKLEYRKPGRSTRMKVSDRLS